MPHNSRHRERKSDGWVYFIECERTRRIKIGWALDPPKRCKDLQCGSPTLLSVVTARPGTVGDEFELHAKFKRVRLHGEWFKRSPALRRHVEQVHAKWGAEPWVPKPPKPEPPQRPYVPPTPQEIADGPWSSPADKERLRNWFLDCFEDGTLTFKTTPDMVARYQMECDERRERGYRRQSPSANGE